MTSPPSNSRSICVKLLGHQQIVLAGLRLILQGEEGFTVMDSTTGDPARADVILIDVDGRSRDLLTVLSSNVPRGSRILMLGSVLDADTLRLALRQGVTGAVLKKEPPRVLLEALRAVADGEVWLDRASTAQLVAGLSDGTPSRAARRSEQLTPREREVVGLIGQGLANQAIADKLFISQVTVRNHLTSVFRKLKVTSRFQLAIYAITNGLSKLPPKRKSVRIAPTSTTSRRKRSAS